MIKDPEDKDQLYWTVVELIEEVNRLTKEVENLKDDVSFLIKESVT